jgi:hypothetical protein
MEVLFNMRNITLEKRIKRLEKLLSHKNENMWDYVDMDKIRKHRKRSSSLENDLRDVFDNRFCGEDYYDSEEEFRENMYSMARGRNDAMVDSAIEWLIGDFGYDEIELEDRRNDIKRMLSYMASDFIEDWGDTWDDDDDEDEDDDDDETDEEREQREADIKGLAAWAKRQRQLRGLESVKRNSRGIRNEGASVLPNGARANTVADVLSSFTDTPSYKSDRAIAELDAMGILDAAINRWYPTADDVADAIDECWNDEIGNGRGAAKFFIGNIDGQTKCSLTLYPISGGDSPARNLVIKFNWPDSI